MAFKFFEVKNPLPNGAEVLVIKQKAYNHAIVLALQTREDRKEYVTWAIDVDSSAYWGHYFKTYEQAYEDFRERG